jgi:hypothetical protein
MIRGSWPSRTPSVCSSPFSGGTIPSPELRAEGPGVQARPRCVSISAPSTTVIPQLTEIAQFIFGQPLRVRDGRSPHTHCFRAAISWTIAAPSCHTCKPFIASLASGKLAFGIEASPAHGDAGSDSGAARIPTGRKPAPWPPTVGTERVEVRRETVKCPVGVKGGKTRSEHIFSEIRQIADIVR